MTTHYLKIKNCFYNAKVEGLKKFEIRDNSDRGFQKGDKVVYLVEDGSCDRDGLWVITYVTAFNQKEGFVVFGDERTN